MRKTTLTTKFLSCFSSPLSFSVPCFSPAAVILLLWALTSCVTSCPKVCQCNARRREMVCHKTKLSDITFTDLDPPPQQVILDHISGLDVLSLQDLLPIKDELSVLKIRDGPLETIPDGTFTDFKKIEELDLSGNELRTLEAESFLGLYYLRSLNISNNRLGHLGSSLSPLGSLQHLDISHNSLQEVPKGVFINQTALISLSLDFNPLKNLKSQNLVGLDKMREFSLRDCNLKFLEDDLFTGKKALRELDLGQNRLTSLLTASAMSDLRYLNSLRFDRNEIRKLEKHALKDVHLQMLDLSYNRIESIDPLVFVNSSIEVLDLSYNTIYPLSQSFLKPLAQHVINLNLAGNPVGELSANVFSDLQLLESLNISSCRLENLHHESFQDLTVLSRLDLSHNNIHSLSQDMLNMMDKLRVVNLHQNAWVCDCHIKALSKWLQKSQSFLKMHCPPSRSQTQDCTDLRCAAPSQLKDKLLIDLKEEDITRCQEDSDGLPAGIQGAIVASCMGFAVILLIITIYLWKRGKTRYGLKRVCVPSDAESSHVVDEDSKVPPLSNCDRASLNVSDHSFVVRHYFDTLVTDPKLMSRTSDSEEPTSPKERDSLYSSQPSLYTGEPNLCAPLGIESTV